MPISYDYCDRETAEAAAFVDALKETQTNAQPGTFDSAASADFISQAVNQSTSVKVPEKLQILFDEAKDNEASQITKALLDGANAYEADHGCQPPADLLKLAMHLAYGTSGHARRKYSLDAATSVHQDNLALQPNRAVVAILSIMSEAIPFAHYLPADIGSNEAILAIMSHNAGTTYGAYAEGGLMDGSLSGGRYISSSRVHVLNPAVTTGALSGKLTTVQTTDQTCDQSGTAVKLLRGRSQVFVNGVPCAREVDTTGSGNSTVSGSITIAGTSYVIGGTINTDTGVFALTTTPAMPVTVPVAVEGFVDYERSPDMTPSIITAVNTYRLYANPWRCTTTQTIDSRTQMSNELGLDPYSESVLAVQGQFANERHYDVLLKARRLSANNQKDHDFEWDARSAQMNRAQIWTDFNAPFGEVSQQMVLDTMNHGITHAYVGKMLTAQLQALPRDMFEPSGVSLRPGIYRIGKMLATGVDYYYTPNVVTETSTSAQVLCIGKATDVTRNPFVLGDAVSPSVLPIAMGANMNTGAAFYARNFTEVNRHPASALGCAMINITNLK